MLTVSSKTDSSGFTSGDLYHAEAVNSPTGVVYLVRDEADNTHQLDERSFRQGFELVKQDPSPSGRRSMGSLREPLSDDDLEALIDSARSEGVNTYHQLATSAEDLGDARAEALNAIVAALKAKHLFTDDEADRLSDVVAQYPIEDYLDEHRAPDIVQRLLDGAKAPQALSESDTHVRRGPVTKDALVIDIGAPYAADWGQGPRLGASERAILRRLRPGESSLLSNGWKVLRESKGFTFTGGRKPVTGFVDERAISPFYAD